MTKVERKLLTLDINTMSIPVGLSAEADGPRRLTADVLITGRLRINSCFLIAALTPPPLLRNSTHSHSELSEKQLQADWCICLTPNTPHTPPPPTTPPRAQISDCSEHLLSSSQRTEEQRRQRGGNPRQKTKSETVEIGRAHV